MLFNSYEFLFGFLPVTALVYLLLLRARHATAAKLWLAVASLFFYGWWNVLYLPLLLGSIVFNFAVANAIASEAPAWVRFRRPVFWFGIAANVSLLGYFKYADWLISNWNGVFGAGVPLLHLLLPLGISFFTFQKIAYLTDIYRGEVKPRSPVDYALFVTFFPQLIAGPIVHHAEIIPQFEDARNRDVSFRNLSLGFFLFVVGLAKKVLIADRLAPTATFGFDVAPVLTFFEAWGVSLAYSAQLYFDFSGYCDMALGAALMFNVKLPLNFDSPYKSLDIQEFWRRWHMTLGRFLRDYVYIPLGGNRGGGFRTYANLMITFLVGGIWHGAGWTFVFWGFLHGLALMVHRAWSERGFRMPRLAAWALTFLFVNMAWVFFRAKEWSDAVKVLRGMAGLEGVVMHGLLAGRLGFLEGLGLRFGEWAGLPDSSRVLPFLAAVLLLAFLVPNSVQWRDRLRFTLPWKLVTIGIALVSVFSISDVTEFLYFQF